MRADEDNGAAFKDHFTMTDITEFTGTLLLMCEWSLTGKKCEQHICVFIGKVILVILPELTGIAVWKGLMATVNRYRHSSK